MPVSHQGPSRNHRRFLEALESEAHSVWVNESLVTNFVAVEITFCVDSTFHNIPDIDNILKPILDALESVVYDDDNRVSDIICRKRFLGFELAIREPSPMLMQVFGQARNRPFVHIRVTEAPL